MTVALTPARSNGTPSDSASPVDGRSALAELYDRFGAVAYSLAYSITRDRKSAETVVTLAFAAAWQEMNDRQASVPDFFPALMSSVRTNAVGRRPGKTRSAFTGATEQAVARAMRELPDAQRNVLALAYFGGLGIGEIGALLSAPANMVKSSLLAALRHLRSIKELRPSRAVGA